MSYPDPHAFVPAGKRDARSPCPALNALANHGYLPHSGHQITVLQLINAMRKVYGVTWAFGTFLAVVGVLWCGKGWTISLDDLAYHNKIEHGASLTHRDARPGGEYAPCEPDAELIEEMLGNSPDPDVTESELIAHRVRRDGQLPNPLSTVHQTIACGEIALTLGAFGDARGRMSKAFLREFFRDQRIPDGWKGPHKPLGLLSVSRSNQHIQKETKRLEEKAR